MPSPSRGLILHRASRTEVLADALAAQLRARLPANPLAAQRVVVAHPGLGRWLLQRLAALRGADGSPGIAANLVFELPGAWLARLMAELLDEPLLEAGPYQREHLRWLLHEELPQLDEPALARYLQGDDAARRRLQLADHLASLFTQYLVYRRDWIAGAERSDETHWQARLWTRVVERADAPHRAGRMAALLQRLERGALPRDDAPLHVFGVNHLPPDTLNALALLAQRRPVHVYFPDPCPQHFWHDIVSEAELAQRVAEDSADYHEVAHPLLAALGGHGQQFNRQLTALVESGSLPAEELREAEDAPAHGTLPLLERLQRSIRALDPALIAPSHAALETEPPEMAAAARADASLRVHACHTRLRELEVLHDGLLALLAERPQLDPRQIVVMAPDIGAYAPLLGAVFGAPGDSRDGNERRAHIPYQLADRALGALHPLIATFEALLAVPTARLALSEVLGLLDVPAVARALALSAGERDAIERWLLRSRVAWGLDEAMKAQFTGAAERRHSFAFGRDRLMLGWLSGEDPAFDGFEGMVPAAGASGSSADALGKLDTLLALLAEARAVCAQPRSASDWSTWLRSWLQRLLVADPQDGDEGAALDAVLRCAASLGHECDGAGVDPELQWPAVREALALRLAEVPRQQRFLPGGVTFCGMVPARVIPFRVVCLLGMNDGEFPREGAASALDLMQRAPRAGDRDARREDRYLFLESLMAAREVLHISYLGESAADGSPRNPAAPLAELLELLDVQHGIDRLPDEDRDAARPWLLRHALQPFDAGYFDDSDGRRFSYVQAYADATPAPLPQPPRPFVAPAVTPADANQTVREFDLAALQRALRDLPRFALQQGFGIRLDALDSVAGSDSEVLEARLDGRDAIPQRLLQHALAESLRRLPPAAPAWLAGSGLLPPGLPGEQAYAEAARHVDAALQWIASELPWLRGTRARTGTLRTALADGSTLGGALTRVFDHAASGTSLVFEARLGGSADLRSLLCLFVEWALLALSLPDDAPLPDAVLLCVATDKNGQVEVGASTVPTHWSARAAEPRAQRAALRGRLARLLALVRDVLEQPAWLPPRTTWSFLAAKPERRLAAARAAWEGAPGARGESEWASYARHAGRGIDALQPGSLAHARFVAQASLLAEVLQLPAVDAEVAP